MLVGQITEKTTRVQKGMKNSGQRRSKCPAQDAFGASREKINNGWIISYKAAYLIQNQIKSQYLCLLNWRSKFLNSYQVAEVWRNVWGNKIQASVSLYPRLAKTRYLVNTKKILALRGRRCG